MIESNSPSHSSVNDKSSLVPIITEDLTFESEINPLDNHKIELNEKFGKLGHLQTTDGGLSKIPVLELLNSSYPNDDGNYSEYHRPCNCTKSYCLKLYCECFARDKLCVNCNCNNCMNNLSHEKSRSTALLRILDKNPLAFLPKIGSGQGQKLHRKGCNCKRSECLKNYCECREAKIECSLLCRCQGCKNRSNELNVNIKSSQGPDSLDLNILESNDFKPSNNSYKSGNCESANEKFINDIGNTVDLNYSHYSPLYDDIEHTDSTNIDQSLPNSQSVKLNDTHQINSVHKSNHHSFDINSNSLSGDMNSNLDFCINPNGNNMKFDENYKINNNYGSKINNTVIINDDSSAPPSKQSRLFNWTPLTESTTDIDQISATKHTYSSMNSCHSFLNSTIGGNNININNSQCYPPVIDVDEIASNPDCTQVGPDASFIQQSPQLQPAPHIMHKQKYTLQLPNSKNNISKNNRYHHNMMYMNQSVTSNHSDNAEVTSTNEIEPTTMLVSSNYDDTNLSTANQLICANEENEDDELRFIKASNSFSTINSQQNIHNSQIQNPCWPTFMSNDASPYLPHKTNVAPSNCNNQQYNISQIINPQMFTSFFNLEATNINYKHCTNNSSITNHATNNLNQQQLPYNPPNFPNQQHQRFIQTPSQFDLNFNNSYFPNNNSSNKYKTINNSVPLDCQIDNIYPSYHNEPSNFNNYYSDIDASNNYMCYNTNTGYENNDNPFKTPYINNFHYSAINNNISINNYNTSLQNYQQPSYQPHLSSSLQHQHHSNPNLIVPDNVIPNTNLFDPQYNYSTSTSSLAPVPLSNVYTNRNIR